jgi:competence protein ComEA
MKIAGEIEGEEKPTSRIFWEEFFLKYRVPLLIFSSGLILVGIGIFVFKTEGSSPQIEVLNSPSESPNNSFLVVDISGEVESPGVYQLPKNSRIEDLLITSGGLSENADRVWIEKNLNRAALLSDGQKLYIPALSNHSNDVSANNSGGYQSVSVVLGEQKPESVNLNTASKSELDYLPGIGPVYAQNIIDHRPYSSLEDFVQRKVIPKNAFEKIKDKVTIY